jgi:hypothetical protein
MPIIKETVYQLQVISLFATAVLVAGLWAASPGRRSLVLGLILAAVDFGIGRLTAEDGTPWLLILQAALWLVTLGFVTVIILEVVLDSKPVTLDTLQAAFCVYLLLGLVWTYFYVLVDLVAPGSFVLDDGARINWSESLSRRTGFLRILILSYSTLTSHGYDALTTASDFANICGCLEAMMAQVYLAVVIARLVGLQAVPSLQEPAKPVNEQPNQTKAG